MRLYSRPVNGHSYNGRGRHFNGRSKPYNGHALAVVANGYSAVGDVVEADFNSTKYPGICKPANFATLDKFKELQRQANRYAAAKGIPDRVTVDGDIGPKLIALIAKATGQSPLTCTALALQAEERTAEMKAFADAKGVAEKVAGPVSFKPSTIVTADGKETMVEPDFLRELIGRPLSQTEKIGLLAVGGGVVYMLLTKKKRRRK